MADKPKDIVRWESMRALGRTRYVLQYGVLMWGVPMFFVMSFVVNRPAQVTPRWIVTSAILWALGGAGFGWTMWWISEIKYQRYLQSKPPGTSAPTSK